MLSAGVDKRRVVIVWSKYGRSRPTDRSAPLSAPSNGHSQWESLRRLGGAPLLPDWSDSGQREGTGPVIWGSAEAAKSAGARIDELSA